MIHLVDNQNRHLYRAQFDELDALRKTPWPQVRRWTEVGAESPHDDDSDDHRALHFLALDDEGRVGVAMRARPTDDRCIIADAFPELIRADRDACKAADCWELSGLVSTPQFGPMTSRKRRDHTLLAAIEAAVERKIGRFVFAIDLRFLNQALRFPWRLKSLGLAATYPKGAMIGMGVPVSCDLLHNAREALAIEGSIIMAHQPARPVVTETEIYELLKAQRLPAEALSAFADLVRDTAALQDQVSEPQLIAMIDRLAARWRDKRATH